MSLNHIQLTNQHLSSLYQDVLIETKISNPLPVPSPKESSPTPVKSMIPALKYLGNNAKNITILVNHATVPYLSDGELSFLTNILSACKLSLADVAIVNIHSVEEEAIESVFQTLNSHSILLFGIAPLSIGLPINFPQFQLQPFNKRTYIYSPTLKELEADKTLKLKLWNNLKTLFAL